ncbi:hypothetical protein [Longivirga aurantiaca]|uniref:Gram-positive cocci surface proteins LPxTG domain-containing protein n=1 Tax=Longivirga aurantiaca TaxID=1837743 RepID=A0ABW1T4H4_9ACTN
MNTMRARVGVVVAGALTVLGTGLVLAPLASTAAAKPGHTAVGICHATSSDSNPYEWIVVDADSTRYRGHLMHRDEPNKHWKSAGTWNGITHAAGDLKRDYIEGLDAGVTEAWCEARVSPSTPPPTTTSAPPATTTSAPPATTTSAPPATTTSAPPATTTSAPPATTTSAPPETEPGTVPPTTTEPGTTPARSTTPGPTRPPLADTGAPSGLLTLTGLVLIALGIATYGLSRPRGRHS